jgi:hypothetical protein
MPPHDAEMAVFWVLDMSQGYGKRWGSPEGCAWGGGGWGKGLVA